MKCSVCEQEIQGSEAYAWSAGWPNMVDDALLGLKQRFFCDVCGKAIDSFVEYLISIADKSRD